MNFQTEPLASSSDDLITPSPNNSLILSLIQSGIRNLHLETGQLFYG